MPDRIIRDELVNSSRYLSLSSDTVALLYIHILLTADDFGNAEAHPISLRRITRSPANDQQIAAMLTELSDHDLIRLYRVESKEFIHIPRYGQRLRTMKGKHPRPPSSIDTHGINRVSEEMSDRCRADVGQMTDKCPPKRSEVKRSKTMSPPSTLPTGFADFWKAWPLGSKGRKTNRKGCGEYWAKKNLSASTDLIVKNVLALSRCRKWQDGFDPLPLVYLHHEGWNDPLPADVDPDAMAIKGTLAL
jgi:hypothetical protein